MWARISLRLKITILVVLIVATASAAFSKFTYSNIRELLSKSTGVGAETAAEALADSIDGQWLMNIDAKRDLGTPEYQRMVTRLNIPVARQTIAFLTVIKVDRPNGTITHVASLPVDHSAEYFAPGTVETFADSPLYAETKSGYMPMEFKRPGFFMVGWAPIRSGSDTVGLVLIATDVSGIKSNLDTISWAINISMLVLVLLSGFLAFKLATSFEKTAVTDGLMGIYNHKYFKQRLEEEVSKARRYKQPTSLVLLDIDFFKRVNDTYGHATGDIVLKNLAKWVTDTCRNTDVAARYGGEEIAVILPFTSIAGAQEFAERLRLKVSQQVVKDPEEKAEFRVTVSIGVAQWEQGMNSMDLIKRTDAALYHSKHMGRNRVTIYQEDILPAPEMAHVAEKR